MVKYDVYFVIVYLFDSLKVSLIQFCLIISVQVDPKIWLTTKTVTVIL